MCRALTPSSPSPSPSRNTTLCMLSSHWPQPESVYMASDLACRPEIGTKVFHDASSNTTSRVLSSHWPQLQRIYMASDLACPQKPVKMGSTMPLPTPRYACSLPIGHSYKRIYMASDLACRMKIGKKGVPRCHRREASTCCVYCSLPRPPSSVFPKSPRDILLAGTSDNTRGIQCGCVGSMNSGGSYLKTSTGVREGFMRRFYM